MKWNPEGHDNTQDNAAKIHVQRCLPQHSLKRFLKKLNVQEQGRGLIMVQF